MGKTRADWLNLFENPLSVGQRARTGFDVVVQNIEVDKNQIADFCRRHRIRRLSLFGSVLRGDFHPDSDVDFLVLFEPGYPVGFRIFDMEEELTHLFGGHRADIVNQKYLNPRLRNRILGEAEVQYEQG